MQGRTLDNFLKANAISREEWKKSGADWPTFQAIADAHDRRSESLRAAAKHIASRLQSFEGVHSVRWRVKDTDHLLMKIYRKLSEGVEKYREINAVTYSDIITDLVGVRALHLFKEDCITIDSAIRNTWSPKDVVIYTRLGETALKALVDAGGKPAPHPKGYRSVHYNIQTQPENFIIKAEVQVRTLFEEGWSEIDHTIRYPNFSNDPTVAHFLDTFNKFAGGADEMGSFVKKLTQAIGEVNEQREQALNERDEAFAKMDRLLEELAAAKDNNARADAIIDQLKQQVVQLKSASDSGSAASKPGGEQVGLNDLVSEQEATIGALAAEWRKLKALPIFPVVVQGLLGSTLLTQDTVVPGLFAAAKPKD
ncbi:RelA/SpoT domain-containing protein [Metapseudomonas otitidis]|uniref:RelA/SpoT domain-containing protein n=1 Tax=Metapseudomonas otitidis TaxID=319939 RepID=UPI00209A9600|nr:RelA/SpoT domain-containing protein [Pseudomonas otitidis]MCO7557362.1 RelA/SpoT domain-containing protein [Pseudomonas otitidis]